MRIMTCTSCSYIFLCLNLHLQKCYRCWIYGLSPWLVLGWNSVASVSSTFSFLFFCFCHFQYIQLQQQEMNEFTEDERRNLEVTVCEMENEVRMIWIHFFSPKSLANICVGTLQKSLVFLLFVVEADQTRKNTNKCFFEAEVWEVWWTCSRGETI